MQLEQLPQFQFVRRAVKQRRQGCGCKECEAIVSEQVQEQERDDRKDVCFCSHKREHHEAGSMMGCGVMGCRCSQFQMQGEYQRAAAQHHRLLREQSAAEQPSHLVIRVKPDHERLSALEAENARIKARLAALEAVVFTKPAA